MCNFQLYPFQCKCEVKNCTRPVSKDNFCTIHYHKKEYEFFLIEHLQELVYRDKPLPKFTDPIKYAKSELYYKIDLEKGELHDENYHSPRKIVAIKIVGRRDYHSHKINYFGFFCYLLQNKETWYPVKQNNSKKRHTFIGIPIVYISSFN